MTPPDLSDCQLACERGIDPAWARAAHNRYSAVNALLHAYLDGIGGQLDPAYLAALVTALDQTVAGGRRGRPSQFAECLRAGPFDHRRLLLLALHTLLTAVAYPYWQHHDDPDRDPPPGVRLSGVRRRLVQVLNRELTHGFLGETGGKLAVPEQETLADTLIRLLTSAYKQHKPLFKIENIQVAAPRFQEARLCAHADLHTRLTAQRLAVRPANLPLLIAPKPWTAPDSGGYHLRRDHPLIRWKSWQRNRYFQGHAKLLRTLPLTPVYNALNALQNTPWRVNRRLLALMQTLAGQDESVTAAFGLSATAADFPKLRLRLDDLQRQYSRRRETQERENLHQQIRCRRERLHQLCRQSVQALQALLGEAALLAEEERFYFAYTLDYRGRAYPVATYLSPQGDDRARALLEFADGKPLDEAGAQALALYGSHQVSTRHIVADLGLPADTRLHWQHRLAWVHAHRDDICRSAADPQGCLWWRDTAKRKKIWQFLAFCWEWQGWLEQGTAFRSHLPVSVDGSSNGLQHFALLCRDARLASQTNVLPSADGAPVDLYDDIARALRERISRDATGPDPAKRNPARLCREQQLISRDLCKAVVMTLPYGAHTGKGIKRHLDEHLKTWLERDRYEALVGYLRAHLDALIREQIPAAGHIKHWLRQLAKYATVTRLPLVWVSPVGLPVLQPHFLEEIDEPKLNALKLGDITLQERAWTRRRCSNTLDTTRQCAGFLPNLVHSLDASHMMLTVNACTEAGIGAFSMIHDSFATHASDVPQLARCLREQFIALYRHDHLERLRVWFGAIVRLHADGTAALDLLPACNPLQQANEQATLQRLRRWQIQTPAPFQNDPSQPRLQEGELEPIREAEYFFQ